MKPASLLGGHWKRIIGYGVLLAGGALLLQWLDYQWLVRAHPGDIYLLLTAAGFLALGVFVGARLMAPPRSPAFEGNPQALAALGVSPREFTVLKALAAGQSDKEIARDLHLSPHTVKTHVRRLFEKLQAKRRTDAVNRARELGILP
jgi:DNA-binding CsgD family transcriptional regulator